MQGLARNKRTDVLEEGDSPPPLLKKQEESLPQNRTNGDINSKKKNYASHITHHSNYYFASNYINVGRMLVYCCPDGRSI